mmetsp:Transcript_97564/g.309435  ORF Transcript_97564/g.309435 Transcript_97564/m.309435 type:complete len:309 (+) Transcript_97564:594-1520(+)
MDGADPDAKACALQVLHHLIATSLHAGEDDGCLASAELRPYQRLQMRRLIVRIDHHHRLLYAGVGCELIAGVALADAHLDRGFGRQAGGGPLDVLWPRGREEERLPSPAPASGAATLLGLARLRAPADDLADVVLEAHVEHPVGLVQDEVRHGLEVDGRGVAPLLVAVAEVQQAARSGDEDVAALSQLTHLLSLADATIDGCAPRLHRWPELLGLPSDLLRQLPRGRQQQHRRPGGLRNPAVLFWRWSRPPLPYARQSRQQEAAGLPAARLGDAHDVLALKSNGPCLRLDGRWRLVATSPKSFHQLFA